jgi:predicted AlkP superfamily pyrophosphatase or phosphodiesterase
MRENILLIIVDCLRYDYAENKQLMPFLSNWGSHFSNHWSSSHCTDPAITHMLFGLHPDELGLYSMMYDDRTYSIDEKHQPIMRFARDNDYWTGIITNLGRWYRRGVHVVHNCRSWSNKSIFEDAYDLIQRLHVPWLLVVHTDGMHTLYDGGSYNEAARRTDRYLSSLIRAVEDKRTLIMVTSDHGEGLGQAGPDDQPIEQHGYGLWDFITHVPLITNASIGDQSWLLKHTDPGFIYNRVRDTIVCGSDFELGADRPIYQVGATPKVMHRGIVWNDAHYIEATYKDGSRKHFHVTYNGKDKGDVDWEVMYEELSERLIAYGHHPEGGDEPEVIERLRGLGYWE